MVIHHDKMAYGKLESLTEKISDDKLAAMAKLLSQSAEECKPQEKSEEKCAEKSDGKKINSDNK